VKWEAWVVSDQHGKFVMESVQRIPSLWNKREAHTLAREMTMEAKLGHPSYRSKKLRYTARRAQVTVS
jgi:hypothetical protein